MSDEFVTITASSKVVKVTLYEQKAQVQRNAEVSVKDDATAAEVVFDDLPSNINRDSLQCNIFSFDDGASQVTLKGLVFDTKTVENGEYEVLTEKQKAAVQRLEEIEQELQACRDQISAIKEEESFVGNCFKTAATATKKQSAEQDYSVEKWSAMLDQRVDAKQEALTQQRAVEATMDTLHKEKDTLTPVAQTSPWRSSTRNVVKVLVASAAKKALQKIAIELTYMVDEASWKAAYEMRVNSESGEVRIGFNAVLTQRTQEAWDDVEVELSTAKPSLSGKQPELKPWRLNIAQPMLQMAKKKKGGWGMSRSSAGPQRNSMIQADYLEEDCDSYAEECEIAETIETMATIEASEVDTAATSVTFKVPGKHSIARDGAETRVTVLQVQVSSTLSFVTVPKEVESAFALAHATNTSEYLLVEGTANIFLDGHYVTKSPHPRTAPGDTFDIGVGVDEAIAVVYKKLSKVQSKEGGFLTSKKSVTAYRHLIKISNHKKVPVKVILRDQIPVSQDSKMTVEQLEPSNLLKSAFPKEDGIWEKKLEIAAGETKEIPIHYEVHYPRDEQVYGLN